MFTDIHSHILYGIDDGPESFEKSVELLKAAVRDGTEKLIATPHFYPTRHSLSERVKLAKDRYLELQDFILKNDIPVSLLSGFEVRFFDGISRIDSLDKLCVNGSKVLLLELEPSAFTEKQIDEILDICYGGYTVVLVHIERYTKISGFKQIKRIIAEGDVLAQCNASSFLSGAFSRAAFKLLKENLVSIIASDMHSLDLRPSNLKNAYEVIEKKFGTKTKKLLMHNAEELFGECL
ncbi:MAG: CpsB/CapC family capsule biosynthesis tyrosine phosphatase [Clostridia bacterium]|nr:CpsB/CapC family capsule biosynthesis tyrosine phosphatase [Clostridia bacterium]